MPLPALPILSQREELALEVIISPSTESARQLHHRVVNYFLIALRSNTVLQTDRKELAALLKALQTSPDREYIAIMTPGVATSPPKNMPTTQQERWAALGKYEQYLAQEPQSFEDHFFRSIYCSTAAMIMQEFVDLGMAKVKSGAAASNKYLGRIWPEALQREKPEEYAKAYSAARGAPSREEPQVPIVIEAQKSTYNLLDTILTTEKPPSLTVITREVAESMTQSDYSVKLQGHEFVVKVDQDTFFWKVKSIETSRLQLKFFWVHFAAGLEEGPTEEEVSLLLAEENAGSQIRVSEGNFHRLLCRSDIY